MRKSASSKRKRTGEEVESAVIDIAICDDSALEREILEALLKHYCGAHALAYRCTQYADGEKLCYELGDGGWYDVVFLDIYLPRLLGMDVAHRLREAGYSGAIVFCTTTTEFAPEGFEVEAGGYLIKPIGIESISRTMDRVLRAVRQSTYPVKCRSKILRVPYDEILFVESRSSRCILHRTGSRSHVIYKKLAEVERELNAECFLRCHRSYLVNLNYVASADRKFTLTTGDVVLIRQKSLRVVRQAYESYRAGEPKNAGQEPRTRS